MPQVAAKFFFLSGTWVGAVAVPRQDIEARSRIGKSLDSEVGKARIALFMVIVGIAGILMFATISQPWILASIFSAGLVYALLKVDMYYQIWRYKHAKKVADDTGAPLGVVVGFTDGAAQVQLCNGCGMSVNKFFRYNDGRVLCLKCCNLYAPSLDGVAITGFVADAAAPVACKYCSKETKTYHRFKNGGAMCVPCYESHV